MSNNKYINMLIDIEDRSESLILSISESDFVESLRSQIDSGRPLTNRQIDKLKDIYEAKVLGW